MRPSLMRTSPFTRENSYSESPPFVPMERIGLALSRQRDAAVHLGASFSMIRTPALSRATWEVAAPGVQNSNAVHATRRSGIARPRAPRESVNLTRASLQLSTFSLADPAGRRKGGRAVALDGDPYRRKYQGLPYTSRLAGALHGPLVPRHHRH